MLGERCDASWECSPLRLCRPPCCNGANCTEVSEARAANGLTHRWQGGCALLETEDACHGHYVLEIIDLTPFGDPTTKPCIFLNGVGPCVVATHGDADCPSTRPPSLPAASSRQLEQSSGRLDDASPGWLERLSSHRQLDPIANRGSVELTTGVAAWQWKHGQSPPTVGHSAYHTPVAFGGHSAGSWIGDVSASAAAGSYFFQLSFSLSAAEAACARFELPYRVDNYVISATLNGHLLDIGETAGFSPTSWPSQSSVIKARLADGLFGLSNHLVVTGNGLPLTLTHDPSLV